MTIRFLPQRAHGLPARGVRKILYTARIASDPGPRPYVRSKLDSVKVNGQWRNEWELKEEWEETAREERMLARLLRICEGYIDVHVRPVVLDGYERVKDGDYLTHRSFCGHVIEAAGMSCDVEFDDGQLRLFVRDALPKDFTGPRQVLVPISRRGKRFADIRKKLIDGLRTMTSVKRHLQYVAEWSALLAPLWFKDLSVDYDGESADLMIRVHVKRGDAPNLAWLQWAYWEKRENEMVCDGGTIPNLRPTHALPRKGT